VGCATDDLITLQVGGVPIDTLIDLGAQGNIVNKVVWEIMKKKKVRCTKENTKKQFFSFG
jgi:hypothetical protein